MKKLILSLILIWMISFSLALGITPGKTNIDYSPGKTQTVSFSVLNSESKDINLVVLTQGELASSISLSEVMFSMTAQEKEKSFTYTVTLPSDLKPGVHLGEVIVTQLPEKSPVSQAFVGATVGVTTLVSVFVPYPGKYAEGQLEVIGPDNGEMHFLIPVINRGEQGLVAVGAIIDIYTSLNEKIGSVTTNEVSLLAGERKEIAASWKTEGVQPGPYRAVATLIYDEETQTFEKEFSVGERLLEVTGIEVNDFILGQIAKFELLVDNKWSQVISQAYTQILVYNNGGQQIADFKSATYDLPALSKSILVAFWDTAGIMEGNYDAAILLKYGEKSSEQKVKFEISERDINVIGLGYVISDSSEGSDNGSIYTILIAVIVVLVLVNVIWFLVIRKKLFGKGK